MWRKLVAWGTVLSAAGTCTAAFVGACSSSAITDGDGGLGTGGIPFEGGFHIPGDGSTSSTLRITPDASTITIDPGASTMETVDFNVTGADEGATVRWRVVNKDAGVIDGDGVFTPSGKFAGSVEIQATVGDETVSTTLTIIIRHNENGGPQSAPEDVGTGGLYGVGGEGFGQPVSDSLKEILEGDTTSDSALSFLYPYDRTVFPLGVLPPLLMWTTGTSRNFEAVYIRLTAGPNYEYKGFFGRPTLLGDGSLVRHPIPRSVWDTATRSAAGGKLTVEVIVAAGGQAYGPITETWTISLAPVTGTIYYQAYGTDLAFNENETTITGDRFGGATLSIGIGDEGPALVAGTNSDDQSGCRVCHSVSAYGDRMVVQHGNAYSRTSSIDLKNGNAESVYMNNGTVGWAGMTPDGTLGLANSIDVTGSNSNDGDTKLYDMETGDVLTSPGLNEFATRIGLPTFSHDGTKVAFVLWEGPSTAEVGAANTRKLVGMDFDVATMTFSNPTLLWEATANAQRPSFSTFMPNSTGVVFQRRWAGGRDENFSTWYGSRGELWWVDYATANAVPLDNANGIGPDGERYVPTGPNGHDQDDRLNYEPSISPVASGGYAWMVFMSRRLYGNLTTLGPWDSDPREVNLKENITSKKIWMAAIDLNAKPGEDPSHPAFYIPGQELHGVNSRPFFALDPCITDTGVCTTGVDCCSGFCENGFCAPHNEDECSEYNEKCDTAADCCSPTAQCIGGFCAVVPR